MYINEIEEELLSDESQEGKKIYSLSKFSLMFNRIFGDANDRKKPRNLSSLGDDPIDEDLNDSDDSQEQRSNSSLSFIKRKELLFDRLDPIDTNSLRSHKTSFRHLSSIDEPIEEHPGEEEVPLSRFDSYKKLKSQDKFLSGKVRSDVSRGRELEFKMKLRRLRSSSFDVDPIREEPRELEGEVTNFRQHVFNIKKHHSSVVSQCSYN